MASVTFSGYNRFKIPLGDPFGGVRLPWVALQELLGVQRFQRDPEARVNLRSHSLQLAFRLDVRHLKRSFIYRAKFIFRFCSALSPEDVLCQASLIWPWGFQPEELALACRLGQKCRTALPFQVESLLFSVIPLREVLAFAQDCRHTAIRNS